MTTQHDDIDLRGARLSLLAGHDLVDTVARDAGAGAAGYVCVANVHEVTVAWRDPTFREVLESARYVSTDSRVLELSLGLLGHRYQGEVLYGVDLFYGLCARAAQEGLPVGLFGGSTESLAAVQGSLAARCPDLDIVFAESPAFGSASELASDRVVADINASGAKVLFVGLGCPKQEQWMHLTAPRLDCVAVGLGAAFDFVAGTKTMSPRLVRKAGLDWLWRLASDPRRLWKRYVFGNGTFLLGLARELVGRATRRRTTQGGA